MDGYEYEYKLKKIIMLLALMIGVSSLQAAWYNTLWSKISEQSTITKVVGAALCGAALITAAVCLYQKI